MTTYQIAESIYMGAIGQWKKERIDTKRELSQYVEDIASDVVYDYADSPEEEEKMYDEVLELVENMVQNDPYLGTLPNNVEFDAYREYEREN